MKRLLLAIALAFAVAGVARADTSAPPRGDHVNPYKNAPGCKNPKPAPAPAPPASAEKPRAPTENAPQASPTR